METLIKKAQTTHNLTKEEIKALLDYDGRNDFLFEAANEVRKRFVGDDVHLRALIEFSNTCSNSCLYCGLRVQNQEIERYNMEPKQIIKIAKHAIELGLKTIVLQSGEDKVYDTETLCEIIKEIKKYDVAITLSIGEKNFEEYKKLKENGADRFLLRIETTDEKLYKKMHPAMNFENRMRCLHDLKKLGYEVGTGSLIGLPEQTTTSLAEDILFFKKMNVQMLGLGPFIPNPQTPLKNEAGGSFELSLKVLAISRLLLPLANIPATTAMETLSSNGRRLALNAGANVIMPNFTDDNYRKNYNLYPNKNGINVSTKESFNDLKKLIIAFGRTIGQDKGNSRNVNDQQTYN